MAAKEPRPAPLPGLGIDPEGPAEPAVLPAGLARDGSTWRIGTQAEVAWIASGTSTGRAITAAIPPVFQAYATAVLPGSGEQQDKHDRAVIALLSEHSAGQPWWLGYLDTGADDIVFPGSPMVTLYSGWHYVLAQAGPEQAATWRGGDRGLRKGALPDLMFPADRSWLVSTLWDDDWSCIGGPAALVDSFLRHPDLQARAVMPGQDATPPGHQAL
jgi:hypothetical protein